MPKPRRLPRMAGDQWRILVHEKPESLRGHYMYGKAHDVRSMSYSRERTSEYEDRHPIPDTEFDELVVGHWIHVEQMDRGHWWMDVSGVVIDVTVDRDGNPKSVLIQSQPVDGVEYDWCI